MLDEQIAFQGGVEALTHCAVVTIANRTLRRVDPHLLAALAERKLRVLTTLVRVMITAFGFR